MNPCVLINKEKVFQNTKRIVDMAAAQNISVFAVTKVFCGNKNIAELMVSAGVKGLADSRLENLRRYADLPVEKWLLRLPMISQAREVVAVADVSLNSELETIKALNEAALEQDRKHQILLMIDLGDLREGMLPDQVEPMVKAILPMEGIEIVGVGVNLTCYGGVIPNGENLGKLEEIAKQVETLLGRPLKYISGGNSSSLYLLEKGEIPSKINQLRVGEAIVLGRETAYGEPIEGTYDDAFLLEAELVECKRKGSVPIGEIGMDAFGNKPVFEDLGEILRGIVAVGHQDVNAGGLIPVDPNLSILGASSDHMLLNLTTSTEAYRVGSRIRFKMDYGGMLKLFTSEYVEKKWV